MIKNIENEISSFLNLEWRFFFYRRTIECQKLKIGKMKVRLGMEQKEPGGYLLEITRDSKELGTGPHESQLTRSQSL